MRTGFRTSAVVVAAGLLTVAFPAASQAKTEKELNVCWVNHAPGHVQDLEVVADGPSYKSTTLDHGECRAWDVAPGPYKITVEDFQEFRDAGRQSCGRDQPDLMFKVTRMGERYKAYGAAVFRNGGLETFVKKDRRTTVTVVLSCEEIS